MRPHGRWMEGTILTTGENIKNAVHVLRKTYESISKMMEQSKAIAEDAGYVVKSEKFMRWRSDADPAAWLINHFIVVFQNKQDEECAGGNHWRNGPVYAMEISLSEDGEDGGLPSLRLSRFDYHAIEKWPEGCSPADFWGFHQPADRSFTRQFTRQEADGLLYTEPTGEKAAAAYWGLKKVVTASHPLLDVNGANLRDVVFGTFDKLADMDG